MGCPDSRQCADACRANESSQHPTCPHAAHRRRCTHQPPAASHSTQPAPLGGTAGSTAALMQASLPVSESATPRPTRRTRRTSRGSRCWCRRRLSEPLSSRAALLEIALTVVASAAISQPWLQSRRWNSFSSLVWPINPRSAPSSSRARASRSRRSGGGSARRRRRARKRLGSGRSGRGRSR